MICSTLTSIRTSRERSLFLLEINVHACVYVYIRSLSVGTRTGYKLYSLNAINDKPDLLFEKGVVNTIIMYS